MMWKQLSFFDQKAEPIDMICEYLEEEYQYHSKDPEERQAYDCETDSFITLPVQPFAEWVKGNFKSPNGAFWGDDPRGFHGVNFRPDGATLYLNDGSKEFVSKYKIYSRLGI